MLNEYTCTFCTFRLFQILDIEEDFAMALFVNCPHCSNRRVNNDDDCPFCGYSVKLGKTREQIQQEAEEEEARLAAEAQALEEARIAEEQARIAEEQAKAAEQARLAAEARAAEQARLAAEQQAKAAAAAQRTQQGGGIFAKFQQKTVSRPQVDISDKVNDMDNLPYIPEEGEGADQQLPPMILDKPVSVATIASTPAVTLTPLTKEKEDSVLPPMQLEHEVTMEEIRNTPAVALDPIQGEVIEDALPDYAMPEGMEQPVIPQPVQPTVPTPAVPQPVRPTVPTPAVPQPVQPAVPTPAVPQPVQPTVPTPAVPQPVQPTVPTPAVPQSVRQAQAPAAPQRQQRQWSSDPNQANNIPQQPAAPQAQTPAAPQRPQRQQRQWSSDPNQTNNAPQQRPAAPQAQAPAAPQRPQRQQRQWSSDPNQANNAPQQRPAAPQQPMQSRQPQQPRPQQPRPQQPRQQRPQPAPQPQQRRPQRSGKIELQPIEQQVSEFTATGERLENLPPQQAPSDPNFDTDSYVRNLQYQMQAGQMNSQETNQQEDILKNAEKVQVQPMKFDGKQIRVSNVNVVKAPKEGNKNLVPIIFVIILVIALIGIAVYIFAFSGLFKKQISVTFDKPTTWSDNIYAFPYANAEEYKTTRADSAKVTACKMEKNSSGTFTLKLDPEYKGKYVIFIDLNDEKNVYPENALAQYESAGTINGVLIEDGKTYQFDLSGNSSAASSEPSAVTSSVSSGS